MLLRSVVFISFLIAQGMRECDGGPARCHTSFLSGELVRATVQVASTTPLKGFYVVFQGAPDECLLSALEASGLGARLLSSAGRWKSTLESVPYGTASQHLLIGNLTWIANMVSQASLMMATHTLHREMTSWVWVVTLPTNTIQPDSSGAPEPPSSLTFGNAIQVVNTHANGMLKGVLLMQEQEHTSLLPSSSFPGRTFLSNSPKPAKEISSSGGRVHVGGMMPRPDWFWELTLVGSYATHNLSLFKPLWPQTSYDFHGGNIYIAFSQKAGTIENQVNTDVMDARGYLADILKIVMEALNGTGVLRLTQGAGDKDSKGTWNGVIGVVVRGEADIGAVDFMPNHQRKEVVDFSVAIGQDPVIIFSSAPYIIIKPMLLLQIFSPEVWACLAGTVIVGGTVLSWLRWVESGLTPTTSDRSRLPFNVILVFKMQVFQSSRGLPPGASARLLAGFLMLVALCIGSVYSGSITAFLVIPFRSTPINSVEEMLDSDVIPCGRSKTNTVANIINNPTGALYSVRHLVRIMGGEELNTQQYMDQVAKGTYAIIDTLSSAMGRANMFTRRGDRCKYHTSRENIQVNLDTIALARNSRYTSRINAVLMSLQYFGFIQNVKRMHYQPLCVAELEDSGPTPLRLVQVQGAFFVLSAGLGLSLAVMVAECLFMRRV